MNAEIERILSNMIRIGVVAELDEANARVKMRVGGLTTDWLPFQAGRAGATRTWSAPRPGEQMMVFAPYGDTGQAVAAVPLYQDDHAAPAASKDQEHTEFPDGSTADYNSASNTLTLTLTGSAKIIINCKEATVNAETSVTLNTPDTNVKGKLTVDGLLTYKAGLVGSGGGTAAAITGDFAVSGGTFTHNSKNVGSTHTHVNSGGSGPGGVPT